MRDPVPMYPIRIYIYGLKGEGVHIQDKQVYFCLEFQPTCDLIGLENGDQQVFPIAGNC